MHQLTVGKPPNSFFVIVWEMSPIYNSKNTKVGITFRKKKKKNGRRVVCVHVRLIYDVKYSGRTSRNLTGHRSISGRVFWTYSEG